MDVTSIKLTPFLSKSLPNSSLSNYRTIRRYVVYMLITSLNNQQKRKVHGVAYRKINLITVCKVYTKGPRHSSGG
jgi:hypothetical protein